MANALDELDPTMPTMEEGLDTKVIAKKSLLPLDAAR